ncbi:uncharacterized protein B0I36DRAFT_370392 [Microdochium trichocladiopsis]|uniref:BZIP domain-containing protein n=1 Tax=Microdochium trichocladiopsis TaxID=1682393 RepID=A0A9P9BHB7_9PEZI|nr:uncharacterized protein B0I36DRAFT_370392 [Microdochium trichocladiopsis]KAH7009464.1 hypothetical protein B0I36DRAFT_370392 [Microdochium trichocladiopsis]
MSSCEEDTDGIVLSRLDQSHVSKVPSPSFGAEFNPTCAELNPGAAKRNESKARVSKRGWRRNAAGTRARRGSTKDNSNSDASLLQSLAGDNFSPRTKNEESPDQNKESVIPAYPEQHDGTAVTHPHEQNLRMQDLPDGADRRRWQNSQAARKSRAKKKL